MGTLSNPQEIRSELTGKRSGFHDDIFRDTGTASFLRENLAQLDYSAYMREIESVPKKSLKVHNELGEAFFWITDANDSTIDLAERSNLFDSWKDALANMVSNKNNLSISHNEILGSLLVAVKNKDISDFDSDTLILFKEATNNLRQNKVLDVDSVRVVESLLKAGSSLTIPLHPDNINQTEENELERMMQNLLERSRKVD